MRVRSKIFLEGAGADAGVVYFLIFVKFYLIVLSVRFKVRLKDAVVAAMP